jgi:uncharacterized membrane protein
MNTERAGEIRNRRSGVNVPPVERLLNAGLGAAAIGYGTGRRSIFGWAVAAGGALLLLRGVTGRSGLYRRRALGRGIEVVRAITIQQPRSAVYRLWRRLDNLPAFMSHLEEVRVIDEMRSRWTIKEGPLRLAFTACITDDVPDWRIAWSAEPGGDLETDGALELADAPGGRGTEVHVYLRYRPSGKRALPMPLGRLFERVTDAQVRADLIRLRQWMETGEVATGDRLPPRGGPSPLPPLPPEVPGETLRFSGPAGEMKGEV